MHSRYYCALGDYRSVEKKNVKLRNPDFFPQLDFLDFTFPVVDGFAGNISDYCL